MQVLVTGRGKSGSWLVRGEQLGAAIGATVRPHAWSAKGFDIAILVKRPTSSILAAMRGVPLIWDIVDAYPQPAANHWTDAQCQAWLTDQVESIKPDGIVAATERMAQDCARFGVPVICIPHHARPCLTRNPIREEVEWVGYEGGAQHLGGWRSFLEAECKRRGWRFAVNPPQLADLDIVVALREADGYAPRFFKSGVKLANAQGSGTPIICNREAGYLENASGAEQWADTEEELSASLDALTSHRAREEAAHLLFHAAPSLDLIAERYQDWLESNFG